MRPYAVCFTGRRLGAIGLFYKIIASRMAESPEAALEAVQATYEFGFAKPPRVKEVTHIEPDWEHEYPFLSWSVPAFFES